MSFIDSYKQLEKICNEIYKNNHGITAYIDDMMSVSFASRYVSSWQDDLKQLKHYRWVRNQIVHEPGCTEENMCNTADIQWLNNFYSRIMTGNDPLTLYRKATKQQNTAIHKQKYHFEQQNTNTQSVDKSKKSVDRLGTFLCIFFAVVITVVLVVVLS